MATLPIGKLPFLASTRPLVSTTRSYSYSVSFRCNATDDRGGGGGGGGGGSTGEEPTESLFMKELKRRGMSSRSRMDERATERFGLGEVEVELEEESVGGRGGKRNGGVAWAEYEKELEGQRDRSLALNSEGLEGLIPRAKLLLSLGATFFLSFGPLILVTIGIFSALYLYLGPNFVHGADKSMSPPQYIDPLSLLEDEMISHSRMAPTLK